MRLQCMRLYGTFVDLLLSSLSNPSSPGQEAAAEWSAYGSSSPPGADFLAVIKDQSPTCHPDTLPSVTSKGTQQ